MDFKIPGLPHSVVKHAQSTSIPQLTQKIENDRDRHALQKNIQQNQSFNLFSPKTQCKVCLSYSNIGIFDCTCGHFLHKEKGRISNSSIIRWTFILFRSTSSRKDDLTDINMARKSEDSEYITANQLKKKCKKKYFQGIHDRFI